jgi:ribosomal protein S18 acetylase RimI-like enzyme
MAPSNQGAISIRPLTEADAVAYREVRLRGLREDPDAFGSSYADEAARPLEVAIARFRARLSAPDSFFLGAFDARGTLLGVVGFTREAGEKERHKATITGMYVVPEARGRGVGRALLDETLTRSRRLPGLAQVQLSVVTRKVAARALYASFGFAPWGLERQALKLGEEFLDEEHLVLFVTPPRS